MIDRSGLSKIENGQRPVTDREIVALAKALKVSPMSLLQEPEDLCESEADKSKESQLEPNKTCWQFGGTLTAPIPPLKITLEYDVN